MTDDPQAHNRKDLRRFYTDLVIAHGWTHVSPLLAAMDALLSLRDARGLFTFTSHEVLTFTAHPEYPAWAEDDVVSITPLRSGQAEVSYVHQRNSRAEESKVVRYEELIATVDPMVRRLATT